MTVGGITQGLLPRNAFRTSEFSDVDLLQKLCEEKEFGVTTIQRICSWGFNRAARKVDLFESRGLIKRLESTPWRFTVVALPILPSSARSTCPHCGGDLLGDGFSTLIRCENYAGDVDVAPDSGPFFCGGLPS